jgi:DNA-binding SARP family transcriptional activator
VLARQSPDADQRMGIGSIAIGFLAWQGDEKAACALIDELAPTQQSDVQTTLARLTYDIWLATLRWIRGESERCFTLLEEARTRYRQAGLGYFDYLISFHLALGALSTGNTAMAGTAIRDAFTSLQPFHLFLLQLNSALKAMQLALAGHHAAALAMAIKLAPTGDLTQAPSMAAMERTFLTASFLETGALDEATSCAQQALELASRLPSDRWQFEAHMLLAGIGLERADERSTLDNLRQALTLAEARDFRGGVSLFQSTRTAKLLAVALRHGIEAPYVKRLIRHRKLSAPGGSDSAELWPVRLRVRTLGGFAISIDDEPLAGLQPATRKPLEVLKALIGFGPTDVSLASFGATLWPELDGAAAHNACHVAIHRLRKILGDDSAIRINQGMVALSGGDAWVDVDVFRQLVSRIRASLNTSVSPPELARLVEQLLAAYPGHFLPGEERSWAIGVREQLRARFLHLAMDLSAALERGGAAESAIALNRHCIELDPLAENFHRGLMHGLIGLGRKAEALEAFKHCRTLLMAGLGVEPSKETYALQARIRQL